MDESLGGFTKVVIYGLDAEQRKISAIKCVRIIAKMLTGTHGGLRESKRVVDEMVEHGYQPFFWIEEKYAPMARDYIRQSGMLTSTPIDKEVSLTDYFPVADYPSPEESVEAIRAARTHMDNEELTKCIKDHPDPVDHEIGNSWPDDPYRIEAPADLHTEADVDVLHEEPVEEW